MIFKNFCYVREPRRVDKLRKINIIIKAFSIDYLLARFKIVNVLLNSQE